MEYGYIKKNFEELRRELSELGRRAGREITLVCVTKSGSDEELEALVRAGATDIGENRPGELKRRGELLAGLGLNPTLHEIGTLQKNKVKYIIDKAALIHSVDSLALAEEISRRALKIGRRVPVLLEINSAKEESKSGAMPEDALTLAKEISALEGVSLRGVMTMGPALDDPELLRPYFRLAKGIFDRLKSDRLIEGDGILSMGMSDSYRVAVEEGSTLVRVGRILFKK